MQRIELPNQDRSWYVDILFLSIILSGVFFFLLGTRPLFVPDEGRYAEIAREMVTSGDYITPYLNQIKYFEKPILFYWLGAVAIKIGGLNLWSIRSINALLGLLGCLLTYGAARQLYGRLTALLSALILATSTLYFVMVHMISLDLPVTVFLSASLYAFLLGSQCSSVRARYFYFLSASATAALAVLTKGLIGIIFPAIIAGAWIMLNKQWSLLRGFYLPASILVFLLIAAPWHIVVSLYNPEFFYFYFIEQHFLRYTIENIGHYQPVWFFIPCLIAGFFPWIVFLPQTLIVAWQRRYQDRTLLFFLLWATVIFIFFSFSKSKLIPYILPVIPPLAILTARYFALLLSSAHVKQRAKTGIRISYFFLILSACCIGIIFYSFTQETLLPDPHSAKIYLGSAALLLIAGASISGMLGYQHLIKAISVTFISAVLFLLMILASMPAIDARTILPLAITLKPLLKPQDEVITYNQYYQDLPFYLERRVSILNWQNELSYGMQHQDTQAWMINDQTFWQRFHGKKNVFVIMSKAEYKNMTEKYPRKTFFLLNETINNVLVSNHPISSHQDPSLDD